MMDTSRLFKVIKDWVIEVLLNICKIVVKHKYSKFQCFTLRHSHSAICINKRIIIYSLFRYRSVLNVTHYAPLKSGVSFYLSVNKIS
jgi:hypothetical protein